MGESKDLSIIFSLSLLLQVNSGCSVKNKLERGAMRGRGPSEPPEKTEDQVKVRGPELGQ